MNFILGHVGDNCPCSLLWRYNDRDGVTNHQTDDCLLNRLFRRRSKTPSKLRVTDLCLGNSPVTGDFPAQRASKAENYSIWWHHHVYWFQVSSFRYINATCNIKTSHTACCRVLIDRFVSTVRNKDTIGRHISEAILMNVNSVYMPHCEIHN